MSNKEVLSFDTKWPFFGKWFLELAEHAQSQNIVLSSTSYWRKHYNANQAPLEALQSELNTQAQPTFT